MSDNCLFCKIINGDMPANIIEVTETALAFCDINPQAKIHILIIPKNHIESTRDLNDENIHYLLEMAEMANKIAVNEGISESGYRWVINTGDDGGQTVHHLHLHLLGGRQLKWPPG